MIPDIFQSVRVQFYELCNYSGYIAADLPSELFGGGGFYIYNKDAEDALEELGTFNCLGFCRSMSRVSLEQFTRTLPTLARWRTLCFALSVVRCSTTYLGRLKFATNCGTSD